MKLVWICWLAIVVSWLFPPWTLVVRAPDRPMWTRPEGFRFIGDPPEGRNALQVYTVDWSRLLLIDLALVGLAGGIAMATRRRPLVNESQP